MNNGTPKELQRSKIFWAVFGAEMSRKIGERKQEWRASPAGWFEKALFESWASADAADFHFQRMAENGAFAEVDNDPKNYLERDGNWIRSPRGWRAGLYRHGARMRRRSK